MGKYSTGVITSVFILIILFCIIFVLQYQINISNNRTESNAMIVVEPRKHKLLKYVCDNFHQNMDSSWDLYVFHGKSSEEYAKKAVANIKGRGIHLISLETDNLTAKEYNKLFKQEAFWNKVNAENILVFQTDAVLCPNSKYNIYDFINYDYIGCSAFNGAFGNKKEVWGRNKQTGIPYNFYGVGGLSFRKKSFMIECIQDNYGIDPDFPEDVFYSECVAKSKFKPTRSSTMTTFCTQGNYIDGSFGAHNITWLPKKDREPFCRFCPEALALLE